MNARLFTFCALAALFPATAALGQAQVGSGHSLDHSLRLGDGGYNQATQRSGPPLNATRYAPYVGRSRAYSPYTGSGTIERIDNRVSNFDVFVNDRSYNAGWQSRQGVPGHSVSASGYNPGATRIDGRVR